MLHIENTRFNKMQWTKETGLRKKAIHEDSLRITASYIVEADGTGGSGKEELKILRD